MSRLNLVRLFVYLSCGGLIPICKEMCNEALSRNLIVTAIEPGCENCGCCVDKVCDSKTLQGYNVSDYCTNGCISGIGGNKCYNKCSDDCVTCAQTQFRNCATCEAGKYLSKVSRTTDDGIKQYKGCVDCPATCLNCTSATNCLECDARHYNTKKNTDCSTECHKLCKACTSSSICQECEATFYNQGDITNCSLSCPVNCVCSSPSVCASCQNGFYNVSQHCLSVCPDSCNDCLDQNTCQSCKDGYYNGKDMSTDINVNDCSLRCRKTCSQCISYDVCTTCKQGYFGHYCQNNCSVGCTNGKCYSHDGVCECKYGFDGSVCNKCETGFYGNKCDTPCPTSCYTDRLETYCQKDNGICLTCPNGFHGDYCNMTCSERCANNRCDKDDGHCTTGCTGDYHGPTCAQVDDTAGIVGIAVGVSAATIVVVIIILLAVFCFILRRWKRRNELGKVVQASYVNTEFQPETDQQENVQTPNEYEALDETEYDEIK